MKQGLILTILLVLSVSGQLNAQTSDEDYEPIFSPTLNITKVTGAIKIDGQLDDAGWKNVFRADHFVEASPGDQTKPDVKSEAMITYDESNLYVALIAWDDPDQIRVSLRERDNIFRDDYFGIMFDTYGDFSWAYEIFVNPLGIQGDLRMLASGNEDISFDIVFESEGIVTDSGYQVEIAIPFSSLRFPDKEEQVWRLDFWRDRQREVRYNYTWSAEDRDDPCIICQWGTMTGIKDIKAGSNIDIIPNIVASHSGGLVNGPNSDFNYGDPEAEVSFNARYGISSNSSIELTINPDFSQIESDVAQVDVNTTFGLYFPERRPFFQEGSDLFDLSRNIIYTRSINDPDIAAKYTGRFGRTSVAYLLAHDENSPIVIPLEEQSIQTLAGDGLSNILRIKRTLNRDSYLGLVLTDRRYNDFEFEGVTQEGGSGSVYGLDGQLRFKNNYLFVYQLLGSQTTEIDGDEFSNEILNSGGQTLFNRDRNTVLMDGESYGGHSLKLNLNRSSRRFSIDFDYTEVSPTFRTANGFVTRAGSRTGNIWSGLFFRPNGKIVTEWEPSLSMGRLWNHDGKFRDEWIAPQVYAEFHGQNSLRLNYLQSRERFQDQLFGGISELTLELSNRGNQYVKGGVTFIAGKRIFRSNPQMANNKDISAWLSLRPNQHITIDPSIRYIKIKDRGDGSTLAKIYIARARLNIQVNRKLSIRTVVQYYDRWDPNYLNALDYISVEPLLTYRINPFTVFYLGMTNRTQYFDQEHNNLANWYPGFADSQWKNSDRQFFVKLQYLFRL